MDNKPGMKNIDDSQPLIERDGLPQQRLLILMSHPDYSLDKAFNGRGAPRPNRNEELDEMPTLELLLDARKRLIEEIDKGARWANDYGYAGFMTSCWERAVEREIIVDGSYRRENYIDGSRYFPGRICLAVERSQNG